MKKSGVFEPGRRQFITKIVPACALTCFGGGSALALTSEENDLFQQQAKHMFDTEMDRKMTQRQFMTVRYRELINFAKALENEWGKEKTIEFIKKSTTERMLNTGKNQAQRSTNTSLNTYVEQFRSVEGYKNRLTKEVVEDTEKAFELKVTECIWATTFLDAKAGDLGYAFVCWGDYAWAEGFNTKIKMVRDKTLMQGDKICNHRYIWTG
jgi:hypothetical protein